jgi:hypothetical protein
VFVDVKMLNKIINRFGNNYKSKNKELWYPCPFHKGQSFTSFSVNKITGFYKCFKCGESGIVGASDSIKDKKNIYIPKEKDKSKFTPKLPNQEGINYIVNYLSTRGLDSIKTSKLLSIFGVRLVGEDYTQDGYKWDYKKVDKITTYKIQQGYIIGINFGKNARYEYKVDTNFNKVFKGWAFCSENIYLELKKQDAKTEKVFIFEGLEDLLSFIILNENNINFDNSSFVSIFGVTNLQKTLRDIGNNKVDVCLCLDNDKAASDSINKRPPIKGTYYSYANILQENQVKDWNELLIKQQSN